MKFSQWFLPHSFHHKKAFVVNEMGFIAYTILLLILGAGLLVVKHENPTVLSFATNVTVADVVKYTNEQRVKNGDSPVALNPELSRAAERKAQDMFAKNYWAHFGPNGEKPWDFIQTEGYVYTAAGENLARDFDDSQSVVTAWMNSPSHRENLLNNNYQDIGVAVVNGRLLDHDTTLVVQMFGKPYKATSQLVPSGTGSSTTPKPAPPAVASIQTPSPSATAMADTVVSRPILATSAFPSPQPTTIIAGTANINAFAIFRQVSLILLVFIAGFLIVDSLVMRKRGVVRMSTHSLTHVVILAVIIGAILLVKSGRIL